MLVPLRQQPERWLFTCFVALLLAPVLAQGLERPLAHVFATHSHGSPITLGALVVALVVWFVGAAQQQRRSMAWSIPCLVALALTGAFHLGVPGLLTLLLTACGAIVLTNWLPPKLPEALDGLVKRHRLFAVFYVLLALFSIMQVSRVSVFMADPMRVDMQIIPGLKFVETHSCLTAYVHADELAHEHVDNLYLSERWPATVGAAVRPVTPFAPFDLDEYFYPPPFLLLAEPLMPLRGDFFAQRAAWFGVNGLLIAAALYIGARAFGGSRWHRPLLIAPIFYASLSVLLILQIGNAQGLVVVLAILGMLAFESERPALGGFALALTTMAKISPGMFGLVLLARKDWRAIAWTVGLGLFLLAISFVVYGTNPLISWVTYAWPQLSSGEAFSVMLHHRESIALNLAPSGVPFKLELLGYHVADPWAIARRINQVFALLLIAFALFMGRRQDTRDIEARGPRAIAWLALIYLGALRSPFAPGYVGFALAWLITLLSVEVETRRGAVGLFVMYVLATMSPPLTPEQIAVYLTLTTTFAMSFAVWCMVRKKSLARGDARP